MANCPEFLFFRQLAIQRLCMDKTYAEMFASAIANCDGDDGGSDTDEKIKITSNDTNTGYLLNKVANTGAISLTEINDGGDESLGIGHADTSSVTNIDTSGAQVIDTLIFDTYGHVIGYSLRNIDITDVFGGVFSVQDTPSIDLTFSGGILSADAIISPQFGNTLSILADGLFSGSTDNVLAAGGGIVTWLQDYDFRVTAANYYLNGVPYSSPLTDITLSPADPLLDRFDVIYVDSDGVVKVREGTPAENPLQPGLDVGLEIGLGVIFLQAGSTQPIGAVEECAYIDNAQWTALASDASINVASATTPCSGTLSIEGTTVTAGDNFKLTRGTPIAISTNFNVLHFLIRSKGSWGNRQLDIQWYSGGTPQGVAVVLKNNTYGFVSNDITTCQLIAIDISDFNVPLAQTVNELRFTMSGSSSIGFFIDNVCVQNNGTVPTEGPYLFVNGLHEEVGQVVKWGGTLIEDTTISQMGFQTSFFLDPANVSSFIMDGGDGVLNNAFIRLHLENTGDTRNIDWGFYNDGFYYIQNYDANIMEFQSANTGFSMTATNGVEDGWLNIGVNGVTSLRGSRAVTIEASRFETDEGADVIAANDLTLPDGNAITVTGNTQINAITTTDWQEGSTVQLHITGTPTLKHNTVGGAGTAPLRLAGAIDFAVTGYTVLELQYKDGFWNEVGRTVATGGGSGLLTADNALTLSTPTNVQWGATAAGANSPLLHDTYINSGGFITNFVGSNTGRIATFTNSGAGTGIIVTAVNEAIRGTSTNVFGVIGQSTNSVGVFGFSTDNTGIIAEARGATSIALIAKLDVVDNSTDRNVIEIQRLVTGGVGTNGIGAYINWTIDESIGQSTAGRIGMRWTDATNPTRLSQFYVSGTDSGVLAELFALAGNGAGRLHFYGDGIFNGTATYLAAFDTNGNIIEYPTGGLPPGGGFVTADNGLTMSTATNVQLGSAISGDVNNPLLHNTYINTAGFTLTVRTATSGITPLNVVSDNQSATISTSNSSNGVEAISTSGNALSGTSLTGKAASLSVNPSSTSTIVTVASFNRATSATAVNGIGGRMDLFVDTDTGNEIANQLQWKWVTATDASRTSQLDVLGVNSAVTGTIMSAYGSGVVGIGISSGYTATRLQVVDNAVGAASIVKVTSTSTAAASNLQKGIEVTLSGANANASNTTVAISASNTHTGGGVTTNFGITGAASGGSTNYGVYGTDGSLGLSTAPSTTGVVGTGVYGIYGLSNNSGAAGVYGLNINASNGTGVFGSAAGSAAKGVWGASTAGFGVQGSSESGTPIKAILAPADATPSTVRTILDLTATTNTSGNVPGNGYGANIPWTIATNNGGVINTRTAADQYVFWTDVTDASRTARMVLDITTDADQHNTLVLSGAQSTLFSRDAGTNQTAERYSVVGTYKTLTESTATTFVRIGVATGTVTGGEIVITVHADDGTDFQARTLTFPWSAVNKAGTITANIGTPVESVAVSAGTLTVTIDTNDAGSGNLDIRANAVSSLTQTTLRCSYQVTKNIGVGTITPQ